MIDEAGKMSDGPGRMTTRREDDRWLREDDDAQGG